KETVALAVALPEDVKILSAEDDKLSYLYQVTPTNNRISYVMDMWWRKSSWLSELSDEELMTGALASVKKAAQPIVVERTK
ncbi:MAG: DUF4861 domain-containing protein, partial [Alistipes sp.]|nr:DUF4861 domain-containing protein [Alistipes sp.]